MPLRNMETLFGLADPFSALTHVLICVVVVLSLPWLVRRARGSRRRFCAVLAYVVCAGGMILASTIYHSLPLTHALRPIFWHLDHGMIWLALAATYTAISVLYLEGRVRHLAVMWAVALTGSTLELSVLQSLPLWASPLLYVAMGWICFPVVVALYRRHGRYPALLLLTGGLAISVGGVIDSLSLPNLWPGVFEAHELLHVTTVFAWFSHLWAICHGAGGRSLPAPAPVAALSVEPAFR